ncbi:pectinesterase-like [Coffea arabica]|uniref:Pectinesterase n=1 Tax=Coffea arabica TaxID=13443 RepID=A0A6P6V3F5_COFAR|nr:pectinesterase-like [Coffea arabica]
MPPLKMGGIKNKTKLLQLTFAALLALLVLLALFSLVTNTNAVLQHPSPSHNTTTTTTSTTTTSKSSIHVHQHLQIAHSTCQDTFYPDLCVSTLATFPDLRQRTLPEIISGMVNSTVFEVRDSKQNCTRIRRKLQNLDPLDRRALEDCLQLLDDTVAQLKAAISDLSSNKSALQHYMDLQTLFSAAMTNQDTCLDGFAFSRRKYIREFIEGRLRKISHHVSNSLAMLKRVKKQQAAAGAVFQEEEGEFGTPVKSGAGFPTWLKKKDRALLQAPLNQTKVNLTVAKDGSGNFTTINDALQAAPNSSTTRFVIYIKAGAYYEYIEVESRKKMIMFLGDGIGKTVIKGNRSVGAGWTTFRSSTVAVVGDGFIARGITVENYAGPSQHQAVALRSGSDLSAFYQCSFIGYQDTLYVHSLRQFYRECDVYGTVDFIFGNAAVVFQLCNLYARRPNPNQQNLFTAQGREDPNQNTGISILNCKVAAAADLLPVLSSFRSYLGRPWREYSRTVYLLSNMESLIDPAGWLPWNGSFALSTLFYGEYKNRGPGSNTTARVKWPGYRVITNTTVASQFTVGNFIQGTAWLPNTGIPFYPNLTPS